MTGFDTFRILPNLQNANAKGEPRVRRSHKKSRLGCVNCKARKLKCDEGKPACMECSRRSLPCAYALVDTRTVLQRPARPSETRGIRPAPAPFASCSVLPSSATLINGRLSRYDKVANNVFLCAFDFELLNHFEHWTCSTIAGPNTQKVYRDELVKIAVNHLYLLDAILAMALLHRHSLVSPQVTPDRKLVYHWKRCLSGFSSHLSQGVNSNDADAMLATATLINGVAFALVEPQPPSQVWPLTLRHHDLSWLYVQRGISTVREALPLVRDDSALKKLFEDSSGFEDIQKPMNADKVSQFQRLYDHCTKTESAQSLYHDTLQILAPLFPLECTSDTILMHLGFIGSMSSEFINLLQKRDHKALLIMSYWYANICLFECWWVSARPMVECAAICKYLYQHADQSVRELLYFPAEASGSLHDFLDTGDSEATPSILIPCATM